MTSDKIAHWHHKNAVSKVVQADLEGNKEEGNTMQHPQFGEIICKVCDAGTLVKKKKRVFSPTVVTIGYLILIPSMAGIALWGIQLWGSTKEAIRFFQGDPLANGTAAFASAGLTLALIYCSFTGGLVGFLLIMKKKVLQCTHCDAVTPAS